MDEIEDTLKTRPEIIRSFYHLFLNPIHKFDTVNYRASENMKRLLELGYIAEVSSDSKWTMVELTKEGQEIWNAYHAYLNL
jgi:hypothetical protein